MKDLRIEIFFLLSPPMKRNVIYRAYVMEIFHPWKRVEESLLLLRLSSFLYALGETMERLFLEEEASYSSEACSPADEVEKERSFNRVWNENSQILGIRVIVGERIFHIIICNVFVRCIKRIRILQFIPLYIELRKISITLIESSLILKSNVNFLHEWIGVKKKFSIRNCGEKKGVKMVIRMTAIPQIFEGIEQTGKKLIKMQMNGLALPLSLEGKILLKNIHLFLSSEFVRIIEKTSWNKYGWNEITTHEGVYPLLRIVSRNFLSSSKRNKISIRLKMRDTMDICIDISTFV